MQSMVAFLGHYLMLCAVISWIVHPLAPVVWRRAAAAAIFLLLLVPVSGLSVGGYLRGAMGDLSITSMVLLGAWTLQQLFGYSFGWDRNRWILLIGAAFAGLGFYPLALGLTQFDPYQLGFKSPWLLLALLWLVLSAWKSHRGAALVLLLALASFNLRLLESTNLWDYLIDPWLVLFAWAWCLAEIIKTWIRRLRRNSVPTAQVQARTQSKSPPVPSTAAPPA